MKNDDLNFELIKKYFRNKDPSESFQVLSDITCNDLDFEELFMFLDRTNSKVGQQYLYNQLRNIPSNSDGLDLREEIIKKISEDADFRMGTQILIEELKSDEAYHISSLFQEEYFNPPKWFFIIHLLPFVSLKSLILTPFNPQIFYPSFPSLLRENISSGFFYFKFLSIHFRVRLIK